MSLAFVLAAALASPAAPPADCQAALGPLHDGTDETALPNQVDGAGVDGREGLLALRSAHGDRLLVLRGGDFAGADLRGARLHNICFLDVNLAGSDWRGAEAPGVGFVRADLTGADLRGARLPRVLLRDSKLEDADATGAVLAHGRLDGGWFGGTLDNLRLDRADLRGFRFDCGISLDDGCPVYQGGEPISLRGADLGGANFFGVVDLAGALIDGTEVGPGQLGDLRAARIEGPVRVRGGDTIVQISPEELRTLLPHLRDPEEAEASLPAPTAPPEWASSGAVALFADAPLLFDDSFRGTALYRRLLPALVGASSSRIAVRVNGNGTIDAAGEAIGANAHSCTLGGEGLSFDPGTGWYSGPHEPAGDEAAEWRGRPMPVLRLAGMRAEVYLAGRTGLGSGEDPRFSDHASCGMRASFAPMVRIVGAEAEALRLLEALRGF